MRMIGGFSKDELALLNPPADVRLAAAKAQAATDAARIAALERRVAKLERGLRLVRNQVEEDHALGSDTLPATQELILRDIDNALTQ
jgi:hypothetical protein